MFQRLFVAALVGTVTFATAVPALAAPACKGQDKSACSANAACTWIDSYSTQSGNKVNAYCRSKGGKTNEKAGGANAKAKPDTDTRLQRPATAGKGSKGTS